MDSLVSELGCINIMQPTLTAKNIQKLKSYVIKIQGESINQDTWYFLCKILHEDLMSVKKTSAFPELKWFNSENIIFHDALRNLMGNAQIPEDVEYSAEERKMYENQFNEAIKLISKEFPETYHTLRDLISFIIIGRRAGYGGGTTSSRIGLIWLSPDKSWGISDWVENILHEYIHNVLFLDDMINSIFLVSTKELQEQSALVISAIRKEKRGYDKSYHSAFVSYGIINHYLHMKEDEKTLELIDPLMICISDLVSKTELISENGLQHIYELASDTLRLHSMRTESNRLSI